MVAKDTWVVSDVLNPKVVLTKVGIPGLRV
jgi:hypothetical protein